MRADDFWAIWRNRSGADVALDASGVVMMRVPLMVSTIVALAAISASGGEQLQLAVSPGQSFAPSNLNIRARVVPHADNRALTVIAESTDFYRSSQIALEGDHAPAKLTFEFHGVPGGEYLISGILTDSVERRRAIAEHQVRVIPSGLGH